MEMSRIGNQIGLLLALIVTSMILSRFLARYNSYMKKVETFMEGKQRVGDFSQECDECERFWMLSSDRTANEYMMRCQHTCPRAKVIGLTASYVS